MMILNFRSRTTKNKFNTLHTLIYQSDQDLFLITYIKYTILYLFNLILTILKLKMYDKLISN